MAKYLIQAAYTSEAWKNLIASPENRMEAIRTVIEGLGGNLEGFYFAFGDYDVVGIVEFPDNISEAAFSIAVAGGGAVKSLRTTPLMSIEDGIEALRKAGGSGYRPPGG